MHHVNFIVAYFRTVWLRKWVFTPSLTDSRTYFGLTCTPNAMNAIWQRKKNHYSSDRHGDGLTRTAKLNQWFFFVSYTMLLCVKFQFKCFIRCCAKSRSIETIQRKLDRLFTTISIYIRIKFNLGPQQGERIKNQRFQPKWRIQYQFWQKKNSYMLLSLEVLYTLITVARECSLDKTKRYRSTRIYS